MENKDEKKIMETSLLGGTKSKLTAVEIRIKLCQ